MEIRTLLRSSAWSFLSALVAKLGFVVAGVVLARSAGPESLGQFGLIQSAIVLAASVAAQAISTATAQHVGRHRDAKHEAADGVCTTLTFGLCIALLPAIPAAVAPVEFSGIVLGSYRGKLLAFLPVAITLTTVLLAWVQGLLSGLGRYRTLAMVNGVAAMVGLPAIVLASALFDVEGALSAILCSQALSLVLAGVHISRDADCRLLMSGNVGRKGAQVIALVGLPILLTGLMVAPTSWIANKLLLHASGIHAVGTYIAATQLSGVLSHVSVVLGGVLVPLLANGRSRSVDVDAFNMMSGWATVVLLAMPLLLVPESLALLYGSGYRSTDFSKVVVLVAASAVVVAYKGGISRRIVAGNFAWYSVLSNLLWALLFIGLVNEWKMGGPQGVAAAFLVAHIVHFIGGVPFFMRARLIAPLYVFSIPVLAIWSCVLVAGYASYSSAPLILRCVLLCGLALLILKSTAVVFQRARIANQFHA
jgi:O-antigen/teichoic acid export membrane protein